MGKGDARRPSNISNVEYGRNYDRIFGVDAAIPADCIATQVECAAITKWPVDLTKMDHPTACKYLVGGMRVRLIQRADNCEAGWDNHWINAMDKYIGIIYIIEKIEDGKGVSFVETGYRFPAFCLQIIE